MSDKCDKWDFDPRNQELAKRLRDPGSAFSCNMTAAGALESQSVELTRLRERNAELEKVLAGINVHRNALLRQNASLEATVRGLREALKPFSDAADKAQISGSPVFYFVGAPDYERARTILKSIGDD